MYKFGVKMIATTLVTALMLTCVPMQVNSAVITGEVPMAGLTLSLDKYCTTILEENAEEEARVADEDTTIVSDSSDNKSDSGKKAVQEENNESLVDENGHLKLNLVYDRLGVANVKSYLNVRKRPNENAKIVGKMTRNSGCHIYKIKKGWAKIVSGKVSGWVKAEYLLTDKKAEEKAKKVATLRVTVTTQTLNVRYLPTTDSKIYDQISEESEYTVLKKNLSKEWMKSYIKKKCSRKDLKGVNLDEMYSDLENWALLSIDEDKVFVSKDFVEFSYNLNRAVTIKQSASGSSDGSDSSGSSSTGLSLVDYAMQFLGNPYVWGGTSLTGGADCSGFVMRIFEHFGYYLPRTSSAQAGATRTISSSEARPGDLFFYGSSGVSHVAIYIGNGQIIHASNARDGIKISSAYYRQPIKIGRVIN